MNAQPKFGAARERYEAKDRGHWERLEAIVGDAGFSLADVLKHWPAFVQRRDIPRFLAHYELFKQVVDLPGSIVELGVFRGSGLFTWSKLMESFCPGDRTRKVFGFDHFKGYGDYSGKDGAMAPWIDRVVGKLVSSGETMQALADLANDDNLLPGVERVRIIEGDVTETIPKFAAQSQGLRLSLLYFDVGLYEATRLGLQHFYPLVLSGGIVAFNGYGMTPWEGEARAIEEYFDALGARPTMRKFPFSNLPHAYFVKP